MNCYSCEVEITKDNESDEHIIPNAIGGRLKSKHLLCSKCNSNYGHSIDAELCNQLNSISAMLMIERENGNPQKIKNATTKDGTKYHLLDGIHPVRVAPEITINEEENQLHIVANDEKQLKHIIKQHKKKYPNLDDEDAETKFRRVREYMQESLHISMPIGGNDFFKAIIKIAINYYLHITGRMDDLREIIKSLKQKEDISNSVVHHFYLENWESHYSNDEVSHTILIQGSKTEKMLFAFVDIFSGPAFIVKLNVNYEGPDFKDLYCYDVLKQTTVNKTIDLTYSGKLEGDMTLLNQEFIARLTGKLNRMVSIADRRQTNYVIKKIAESTVDRVIGKYPEGTLMTAKIMKELNEEIAKEAVLFIQHIKNRGQRD